MLGHKADLMFVHFRNNFEDIAAVERALSRIRLWDFLDGMAPMAREGFLSGLRPNEPVGPIKARRGPAFCNQFYLLGITMIAALLLANAAAWILLAMALIIVR